MRAVVWLALLVVVLGVGALETAAEASTEGVVDGTPLAHVQDEGSRRGAVVGALSPPSRPLAPAQQQTLSSLLTMLFIGVRSVLAAFGTPPWVFVPLVPVLGRALGLGTGDLAFITVIALFLANTLDPIAACTPETRYAGSHQLWCHLARFPLQVGINGSPVGVRIAVRQ